MRRKTTIINWKVFAFSMLALVVIGCATSVKLKHEWKRDLNVCKSLKDNVLVYPIFVSEKRGAVWTKEEIATYMDSLKVATDWLTNQAYKSGMKLSFLNVAHPRVSKSGLPGKSIDGTYSMIETIIGIGKVNKHYDGITKKEFNAAKRTKEAKAPYISRPKTKDQFVSRLRNNYQVESVALMFIHKPEKNNKHIIFCPNTLSAKEMEYSVSSFKSPNLIAEQILELFGAAVLHYDVKKKKQVKIEEHIEKHFPNDIMAKPMQNIRKSEIGDVTKYLIGWTSELDPIHEILMEGGKVMVKK